MATGFASWRSGTKYSLVFLWTMLYYPFCRGYAGTCMWVATMRQMSSYPNQGPVTQFHCTDCDWVFYVQKPITPDVTLEIQRSYARRWFASHSCFESPRSKYGAFRTSSQPHASSPGAKSRVIGT
jgi:hypothetical protein